MTRLTGNRDAPQSIPTVARGRPPAPRCSGPARLTTTTPAEGRRGAGTDAERRHAADDPAVATILTTAHDILRITVAFSAGRISIAPRTAAPCADPGRASPPARVIVVDPSTPTTGLDAP